MNVFDWLVEWYKSCCDGNWEHSYGIKIGALDNPGWSVKINLNWTDLEEKSFKEIAIDNGDNDWIFCKVEDKEFRGYGDPDKLNSLIEIFKNWAEQN